MGIVITTELIDMVDRVIANLIASTFSWEGGER